MAIGPDDLDVFLAVARHGSFGRAAAALFVSQPAVSDRIARLERIMGATLFRRGARGTALTDAGERLLPYAQRVIGLLEEATAAVASTGTALPLRVGVHVSFSHRALAPVMAAVSGEDRAVQIIDAHSDEILAMLVDGLVDVGFVLSDAPPPAVLRFLPLRPDPVVAVCAPSHRFAARTIRIDGLSSVRLAINRWGTGASTFLSKLTAAGVREARVTQCSDAVTALRVARDYDHIALVTESIAADAIAQGELARVILRPAPRWSVPLTLAYRVRDHDDATIQAIRDSLPAPSRRRALAPHQATD